MAPHMHGRIPLPPRAVASGGEGLGVGGSFSATLKFACVLPPTPDPSPPRRFASREEGRGAAAAEGEL